MAAPVFAFEVFRQSPMPNTLSNFLLSNVSGSTSSHPLLSVNSWQSRSGLTGEHGGAAWRKSYWNLRNENNTWVIFFSTEYLWNFNSYFILNYFIFIKTFINKKFLSILLSLSLLVVSLWCDYFLRSFIELIIFIPLQIISHLIFSILEWFAICRFEAIFRFN